MTRNEWETGMKIVAFSKLNLINREMSCCKAVLHVVKNPSKCEFKCMKNIFSYFVNVCQTFFFFSKLPSTSLATKAQFEDILIWKCHKKNARHKIYGNEEEKVFFGWQIVTCWLKDSELMGIWKLILPIHSRALLIRIP